MKKRFAMLLALCLLCGAGALAEGTPAATRETNVTYTIAENTDYTVEIPATVALTPGNETGSLAITIKAPNFNAPNHWVSVKLTGSENFVDAGDGTGQFYLKNGNTTIPYGIKMQSDYDAYVEDEIAVWFYGQDEPTGTTTTLTVTANPPAGVILPAGAYTDRLTFTAGVEFFTDADQP